jgi:hypothetical protein
MILDEFILAGEIQETSKKARQQRRVSWLHIVRLTFHAQVILERMEELEKIESQDGGGLLDRLT